MEVGTIMRHPETNQSTACTKVERTELEEADSVCWLETTIRKVRVRDEWKVKKELVRKEKSIPVRGNSMCKEVEIALQMFRKPQSTA